MIYKTSNLRWNSKKSKLASNNNILVQVIVFIWYKESLSHVQQLSFQNETRINSLDKINSLDTSDDEEQDGKARRGCYSDTEIK